MSTIESYDGLCGIIPTFASSDLRLRCNYPMGHHGPCSWEKYRNQFIVCAGASILNKAIPRDKEDDGHENDHNQ